MGVPHQCTLAFAGRGGYGIIQYPGPQHPQDIAFPNARLLFQELNRFEDKNMRTQESMHPPTMRSLSCTERRTRPTCQHTEKVRESVIFIRLSRFRTTSIDAVLAQGC